MTHVLIVEDDPMARQLLEIYINQSENYTLVQSVESAALTEFCCRTNQIDLILMDVCTAMNASGLEAAERMKQMFPDIKIIIITSQPEYTFIDRARAIGVDSFWYKSASAEEIQDQALEEGMSTLRMSATRLVKEGITSVEELMRIAYSNEDDMD